MTLRTLAITAACAAALLSGPVMAQDDMYASDSHSAAEDPALLSFGVGVYDIGDDDDAADFRMEYRSGDKVFWEIKPWVGLEATSEGSVWGGGGVLADFNLSPEIYITPSFGVGLYGQGSSDLDLGSVIEFRSQIEGGYEFTSGHKVGVAFGHISNASIDDQNPGTEILNVYYHMPVGEWF